MTSPALPTASTEPALPTVSAVPGESAALPLLAVAFGEGSAPALSLFQAARGLCRLVWLVDGADPSIAQLRQILARAGPVVDIGGLDTAAAAAAVAEFAPDGITTFFDRDLVKLAELGAALGLRFYSPEVALRLSDKVTQRAALAAHGLASPRCQPLDAPHPTGEQLADRVAGMQFPCVLKPRRGTGSINTFLVRDVQELAERLAQAPPEASLLVEEAIIDAPGAAGTGFADYVSVETVVHNSVPTHVTLTGRFPLAPPFRETGFFVPADLTDERRQQVLETADAAVAALGVLDGTLHIEVKFSPGGPQVLEVNGRAGGWIPELLASISEVSLMRLALAVALGQAPDVSGPVPLTQVAYRALLQPQEGARVIQEVRGLQSLATRPEVDSTFLQRGPGAAVDERHGSFDFVASVSGRVDDHDALRAFYTELLDLVAILYVDTASVRSTG